MMSPALLGVVVPVGPGRLDEVDVAVHSVRRADVDGVCEIIVVVDGPYEPGARDVAGADVTVRLDRTYGPGTARLAGALRSTCESLFFLDSDDEMQPDAPQRALADLADHAAVMYATADADGWGLAPRDFTAGVLDRGGIADRWLAGPIRQRAANLCVRREVLLAAGGFSGLPRMEDWLVWAAISESHSVLVSDFVARTYRDNPGGVIAGGWPKWLGGLAATWIPALVRARQQVPAAD